MAKIKKNITVQGTEISLLLKNEYEEYFSLTDIARKFNPDNPSMLIINWMRNKDTIEFLGVWEKLHNPDFNPIEFDKIKNEAGLNRFILSAKNWIKATNAIGIQSKAGRYGGTFAHRDIALGFCYWLSPPFQLYLIKEFQRLKKIEAQQKQDSLEWSLKRLLTKINYSIHTDAIKETLIPPRLAQSKTSGLVYASEADLLNMALFGMTVKEWRLQNTDAKGNIRDYATTEQLLVLANLEAINAELIRQGLEQDERVIRLNEAAITQMRSILNSPSFTKLPPEK
jgi:hypothetical protein